MLPPLVNEFLKIKTNTYLFPAIEIGLYEFVFSCLVEKIKINTSIVIVICPISQVKLTGMDRSIGKIDQGIGQGMNNRSMDAKDKVNLVFVKVKPLASRCSRCTTESGANLIWKKLL
jgi:hypothetical protein